MTGRVKYINQKGASLKGQITQLEQIIENIPTEPAKLASLKARIDRIKVLFEGYEELHDELALLDDAGDHNIADFKNVQERYYNLLGKSVSLNSETSGFSNALNTSSIVAGNNRHRLKLPVADLPKFYGDIAKRLSFKNAFTTMVGSSDISDLQKCMYLQNCLSGDALRKISIYNVSEENFKSAWQLLLEAYDQKRILMVKHLDAISNIKYVHESTHKNLSSLIDEIRFQHSTGDYQMADLPESRVNNDFAFNHTVIDYFGPIFIKEKKVRNRNTIKVYGCIFVSMFSRAIYI
uniref:Uncharacterized protein n=1 Tax=Trichogramma kaykai TaxID=54128 RepID=A0ABD2W9J8_9HYME